MDLPVWDEEKTLQFKGRWNALNRRGRQIDRCPTTNDTSRVLLENNVFPEAEKLTPPFQRITFKNEGEPNRVFWRVEDEFVELNIAQTSPADCGRKKLTYTSLYEGFAHLLHTQESNPPTQSLIRHLDGEDNRRAYYQELEIPKKRGGTRTLDVPHDPLKWLQRSLLIVLTHLFPRHKCAHGFERGKSIVTHAEKHVRKSFVYTVDIEDFFPSITWSRVFGMLQAYPFKATKPVARYIANLVTYKGRLPQGAPTSPILANLLCRRLDSRLFKWARENGYTYTRYADDLTFSTNRDSFPEEDRALIDQVIRDEGFAVNESKKRLMTSHQRQMVTGLVVNEKVNLPREKIRGIRALLHNIKAHGWESQLRRKAVFDSGEEWREYITGRIDLREFRKIDKKQREKHLLVNPSAQITKAQTVRDLQRVVQGKVEFLRHVRGKDDPVYQRMSSRLNDLVQRYKSFSERQKEGRDYSRERREKDEGVLDEISENGEVQRQSSHYKQLQDWLHSEDMGHDTLRERLEEWREHSLEMGWLLDRTAQQPQEKWLLQAKQIAYALDTRPEETALFFRRFDDDKGFRGLLHDPEDISAEPETILGACRRAFEEYRLPNGLQESTEIILKRCSEWMEAHEGSHPWRGLKDEVLQPYKEETRFQVKPGQDLIGRLKEWSTKSEDEIEPEVIFHAEMGKTFRTHVPSVFPPIKKLVQSMAEHTITGAVHVDIDRVEVDQFTQLVLKIWDEGGEVRDEPELKELFSGDTRRALYNQTNDKGLRGYARWTFIAPFANGNTYEFDVMRNQRSEVNNEVPGVMHRITFYK